MLKDTFFRIVSNTSSGSLSESFSVTAELMAGHEIYNGHFPGNPVAPGVCLIQMIKEALEDTIGKKLILQSSDNIKFMAIVTPAETQMLTFSFSACRMLDDNTLQAAIQISSGEKIFMKCKNRYQIIS